MYKIKKINHYVDSLAILTRERTFCKESSCLKAVQEAKEWCFCDLSSILGWVALNTHATPSKILLVYVFVCVPNSPTTLGGIICLFFFCHEWPIWVDEMFVYVYSGKVTHHNHYHSFCCYHKLVAKYFVYFISYSKIFLSLKIII